MNSGIIIQRRNDALEEVKIITSQKKFCYLIHYSCESFYDNINGHSPRITSIAVRHLSSGQTKSFSIHMYAEREGVCIDSFEDKYNQLEKKMLDDFYNFIKIHSNVLWIHWNMRDMHFGFEAIAHRYAVLGGNPVELQHLSLHDLARLLIAIYGENYTEHPRLESIIKHNKISTRDFLTGNKEAEAFQKREYLKLHRSTLRKVDIFSNLLQKVEDRSLKTQNNLKLYILYPRCWGEKLAQHWLLALLLAIIAIVTFLEQIQVIDYIETI